MIPKTATHYGIGVARKIYYRKLQIETIGQYFFRVFTAKWEFYCPYTDKWYKSYCPHELVEL